MRKNILNGGILTLTGRTILSGYLLILISGIIAPSIQAQDLTGRPDRGTGGKGTETTSGIDNINLQNGNVSLQIPLASLPPVAGGKLSYSLTAYYNSSLWNAYRNEARGHLQNSGCDALYTTEVVLPADNGGWRIGGQYEIEFRDARADFDYLDPDSTTCYDSEFYLMAGRFFKPILKMPDGSEHEMRIDGYFPTYTGNRQHLYNYYRYQGTNAVPFGSPIRLYTVDGTYVTATYDPSGSYTIYLKDGTQISPATGGQRIKDTNGNTILNGTRTVGGNSENFIKDEQTGREIKWSAATYNSSPATKVEYQTVGGVWQTVWAVWGTTTPQGILYTTKDWNPTAQVNGAECSKQRLINAGALSVIREIILPATEQSVAPQQYSFDYNSDTSTQVTSNNVRFQCSATNPPPASYTRNVSGLGEVSRITTPTGLQLKYTYVHDTFNLTGFYLNSDNAIKNGITKKEAVHDGVTDVWTYDTPFSSLDNQAAMTSPDGSSYSEAFYPTDPLRTAQGGTDGLGGLTYRTFQSGKIMTERHWTLLGGANLTAFASGDKVTFNPVVDTEYTSLLDDSGNRLKMTAKKFQYDYNGELTQTVEYDWFDPSAVTFSSDSYALPTGVPAGATALRTVNTSFYNQAANASSTNAYQKRTVGTSTIILGAVQETSVGASITRMSYDSQTYGTAPTKGNLTQASVWNDTNSTWLNSSMTYDTYGNVITKTDPKGYTTQIFYEDLTHALPTKTIVDPQNGSGQQIATMTYDFSTGAVLTTTDINGNTSSVDYTNLLLGAVDPFGRPGTTYSPYVSINGTNQRLTSKTYYEDAARKTRVEADVNAENDAVSKARESRDQLGRTVLTERNENGANAYTISSETIYNTPLDRTVMTSNPHRSAAAATDGWTRVKSDILGRGIEAATFSGTTAPPITLTNSNWTGSVTTAYATNATTVTDQAGKLRRSVVNALGQLIRVDEPNAQGQLDVSGSPVQSTNYSYDALGNLKTVSQGVQTRTFVYDSLSRLKSATNPESGTINYTYDNNGNLATKIDANTITTTYTYDALNRVTLRDYSDTTPDVTYTYENATITSRKGVLTKVANNTSTTEYVAFDTLGRVTQSRQTTDGVVYGDNTNPMTYTYNLGGALIEQKYPSGRVVKNVLDTDGDLSLVQSKKNSNAGYWNYAKSFTYTAAGAVSSMQLGNGRWESTAFNSRLQPTNINLGTTQGAADKLNLAFTYGTTQNNGNVLTQTITTPAETRGSTTYAAFTATQTYNYDELNRLKDATETISSQTGWKQTFTYDRYGNRSFDEGSISSNNYLTTTLTRNCQTSTYNPNGICDKKKVNPTFAASNRINQNQDGTNDYLLDSAGNTTKDADGRTFIYDAENKQIEVKNASNVSIGQYFYDGDGKRVKKVAGTETTIFVYDASGKMVAEYATTVASQSAAQVSYLTSDHLGSPRINTDANGAVTARHDYQPFGEEIAVIGGNMARTGYSSDAVRQKFTGYERDDEIEEDFAEARYYNYKLGKFNSSDPLMASAVVNDPQSWNRYSYVGNNPLNFTDSTGMRKDDNDNCPDGKICNYDENGKITDIQDDTNPIRVFISVVGAVVYEIPKRTTYVIEWTIRFPKQIPDPTPLVKEAPSIIPRLISVPFLIHAMGTTIACSGYREISDGNGGCRRMTPEEITKIYGNPDIDTSANPNPADNQPTTNNDTESPTLSNEDNSDKNNEPKPREHTKNKSKARHDKHTKPRSGRPTTKDRQKWDKVWRPKKKR